MFLKPLTKDEYGLILGTAERDLGMDRDGFSVYMWPQLWSSTSHGFGGIGGAAMCWAHTVVIMCSGTCSVFHAGRFAYTVRGTNDLFGIHMAANKLLGKRDFDINPGVYAS